MNTFKCTKDIKYCLTITDGDTEEVIVKITAPTEEMMLEKLGAWERSQNNRCLACSRISLERFCDRECAAIKAAEILEDEATGN